MSVSALDWFVVWLLIGAITFQRGEKIIRSRLCRERSARQKLEAEVERLKKPRYPLQTFRQFCDFLTSNNIVDELAVSDPEGWDGGAELDRIEIAYDKAWKLNNK